MCIAVHNYYASVDQGNFINSKKNCPVSNYFNFAEVVNTVTKSLYIVFKSFVSTNFTTRALMLFIIITLFIYNSSMRIA